LVPEVYIETLNLYLGSKAQQYRLQNPSSSSSSSTQPDNLSTSRQSIGFSASEHDNLGRKLAAQQKWARSLSRQIDAHKASSDGFNDNDGQGRQYAVRPPRDGRRLKRQGPYLVQPEPKELPLSEEAGWGVEGVASDIVVVADKNKNSVGRGHVAGPKTGMNVVGIAWVDGRVDLCIEAQKVEAEWEMEDVSAGRDRLVARIHADSLDVPQNQDWAEEPLLTLVTFDSIDLEILESLESASESFTPLVCNGTTFTIDPMDSTSLFVHHVLGAHWIGFKSWKTSLSHVVQMQDADEEEQELGELWKKRSTSQCAWVVDTWSGQEGYVHGFKLML
jgi:nucleoporin NUP82